MPKREKTCLQCGTSFIGRPNREFCDDHCRMTYHAEARKMARKEKREKDPEAQRRGRANRAKGARAENEVCHLIRDVTGNEVRRNLSQTRDAGGDVKWGPFYLEVKYQKTIAMPAWQEQARASAAQDGDALVPAVVYRRPNEQFWISLPFREFLLLFESLRLAAMAAQNPTGAEK